MPEKKHTPWNAYVKKMWAYHEGLRREGYPVRSRKVGEMATALKSVLFVRAKKKRVAFKRLGSLGLRV